jgi:hypothetical protein
LPCPDADGDGLCDATDPCTNAGGLRTATRAKLKASRLLPPGEDDVLAASGVITIPAAPPIDPVTTGVRVLYGDQSGTIFDTLATPGAWDPATRVGWVARNGSFKYVDGSRTSHLIKVVLKATAAVPGQYKVTVKGRDGTYAAANPPVRLIVVADPPHAAAGACGEWLYPATAPATPSCITNAIGSVIKCR